MGARRILCRVWGCIGTPESNGYDCKRCRTNLYEGLWVEPDGSLMRWYYRLIAWWLYRSYYRFHRCEVCDAALFLTDDYCCSDDCYDNWIPF